MPEMVRLTAKVPPGRCDLQQTSEFLVRLSETTARRAWIGLRFIRQTFTLLDASIVKETTSLTPR